MVRGELDPRCLQRVRMSELWDAARNCDAPVETSALGPPARHFVSAGWETGWPAAGQGKDSRHHSHQYSLIFFRLTPPAGGGLKSRHENKPLSAQDSENPKHCNLFGARRNGRSRLFDRRVPCETGRAVPAHPDRGPATSQCELCQLDRSRSVARARQCCAVRVLPMLPSIRCPSGRIILPPRPKHSGGHGVFKDESRQQVNRGGPCFVPP